MILPVLRLMYLKPELLKYWTYQNGQQMLLSKTFFVDISEALETQTEIHNPIEDITTEGTSVATSCISSKCHSQSGNDHYSFYYQNMRGIKSKLNELKASICDSDYDVIAVTETWLNSSVYTSEFCGSYNVF